MALALTSRRRALAAVASATLAMALAAAVAGRSCKLSEPGADVAVHGLLAAAQAGDRKAVFDLLTPETQALLTARAQHATDLVGSSTRYTALDMISIGNSTDVPATTDITVVEEHGDRAVVELVSSSGRSRLNVVRSDGRWRVEMPQ